MMRSTCATLIAIASMGVASHALAQNKANEALGDQRDFLASGHIDRSKSCPGDGCTSEMRELADHVVGLWQTDLKDFSTVPADDSRHRAKDHAHILRLDANGRGVLDASADLGGSWCRAGIDWAIEPAEDTDSFTLYRVFNADSTCERSPPGVAKPLIMRFVDSMHGDAMSDAHASLQFRGTSIPSWDEPVKTYYVRCDRDPLAPSEACGPHPWRPQVHVGKAHAQSMSPWKP